LQKSRKPGLKTRAVVTPHGWKRLSVRGLGPFVTRESHRRADGVRFIWSSSRHRKRRGGQIATETGVEPAGGRRRLRLWSWEPDRLQWRIAIIFLLAEVCHSAWEFMPDEIGWWIVITGLVGSAAYVVSAIYGFFGQGPIPLGRPGATTPPCSSEQRASSSAPTS
jgi:hypothetical protein